MARMLILEPLADGRWKATHEDASGKTTAFGATQDEAADNLARSMDVIDEHLRTPPTTDDDTIGAFNNIAAIVGCIERDDPWQVVDAVRRMIDATREQGRREAAKAIAIMLDAYTPAELAERVRMGDWRAHLKDTPND